MDKPTCVITLALMLCSCAHSPAGDAGPDAATLASIATGIEQLRGEYPQLEAFSAASNMDARDLRIDYAHRTHQPTHAGGRTAGIPNPDDDGLWFHLDFHEPTSSAQIHTQPMTGPPQCLGDKRVSFLILEGANTKSVSGAIWQILRRHGVVECPAPGNGGQPRS